MTRVTDSPLNPPPGGKRRSEAPEGESKEFKLPDRKQERTELGQREKPQKEEDEEKPEERVAVADFQQRPFQAYKEATEVKGTPAITPAEAKKAIEQVTAIIQKMVDRVYVGDIGGQTVVKVDFKASEVPTFLAGASMNMSEVDGKVTITFSNMSPQSENIALQMMQRGEASLMQLMQSLQAKNITLSEIRIGNLPPIVMPQTMSTGIFTQTEGFRDRQGGGQGGGGQEEKEQKERKSK